MAVVVGFGVVVDARLAEGVAATLSPCRFANWRTAVPVSPISMARPPVRSDRYRFQVVSRRWKRLAGSWFESRWGEPSVTAPPLTPSLTLSIGSRQALSLVGGQPSAISTTARPDTAPCSRRR